MDNLRKPVGALVILLVLCAILYVATGGWKSAAPQNSVSGSETQNQALPPFTPAIQAELAASHGFQYLVSYTNQGFEPNTLSIKKGETVRFTNNSSEELWIASKGVGEHGLYPGTSDCGGTAFDTCKALQPREFWEFTFDATGTWSYQNNTDPKMTGTVTVQ